MQEGKRKKKTTAAIQQSCFLPLHELGSHPCSLDGGRRKGDFDETKTLDGSRLRQRRKAHKKSVCFRGMPLREIPGDSGKKGGNYFFLQESLAQFILSPPPSPESPTVGLCHLCLFCQRRTWKRKEFPPILRSPPSFDPERPKLKSFSRRRSKMEISKYIATRPRKRHYLFLFLPSSSFFRELMGPLSVSAFSPALLGNGNFPDDSGEGEKGA